MFLVAQIIEEVSLNLDNALILGLLSEPSLLLDLLQYLNLFLNQQGLNSLDKTSLRYKG